MLQIWVSFVVISGFFLSVSSQVIFDGAHVTHEAQGVGKYPFYFDNSDTWNVPPSFNSSIDYDGEDFDEEDSEVFEDDSPYEEFGLWDYALDNGQTGIVDYNNITGHLTKYPMKAARHCTKCRCGTNVRRRIIGGSYYKPGHIVWLVLLRQHGRYICGGSLICSRFVLTAAHCMTGTTRSYSLVLHVYNRLRPGRRAIYRRVKRIYRSRYQPGRNNRDIALLKLNKPVRLGSSLVPVCLPTSTRRSYAGRRAVVAGWGLTENNRYPRKPKKVVVPVLSNKKCKKTKVGRYITKYMLCAGYRKGGRDSCSGDSGGPLMIRVHRRYTLIGIVSWGFGCAQKNSPGVYTRVNKFLRFIHRLTRGKCCFCKR